LPIPQATELLLERTRRSEDSRADAEELAIALNLANTLRALGNSLGARDLHEQCLEVRRRVLGDEHPDTLRSMNNLAFTLRDLGEIEEARSLFSAAARGSRKVLGEDHPETKALVTSFQEFEESHPRDP
jgi:tetratricopeptide (TPR) repeat protein